MDETDPLAALPVPPQPKGAAVLRALLGRRSVSPRRLLPPGPGPDELRLMAQAAARAPDHGGLRPWRFRLVEGAARAALGAACADALAADDPAAGPERLQREREKIAAGPCLVAVLVPLDPRRPDVPLPEQHASTGAAILGFLLAAEAMGYAGIMLSGERVRRPGLRAALGLPDHVQLAGFLTIGRPGRVAAKAPPAPPADLFEVVDDPTALSSILRP
ncbi:nitroreductase family protein [Marinibaculum pumilum]|uniref:Putative NAD(P)H nitroreductase n=1 Tax=Marinibaculum pumilum TaxID=1766165 RepID=A0ABV7KVD7_9PROT